MHVVDRRGWKTQDLKDEVRSQLGTESEGLGGGIEDVPGDSGNWLRRDVGNRVYVCEGTPGERVLVEEWIGTVFGVHT